MSDYEEAFGLLSSDDVRNLPDIFTNKARALLLTLQREGISLVMFRIACDADEDIEPTDEDKWLHVSWPYKRLSAILTTDGEWSLIQGTDARRFSASVEDHEVAMSQLIRLYNEGCFS